MATTSGPLALAAVEAMRPAGLKFAVLHKEAELARGEVASDVELVADRPVADVVRAVAGHWQAVGLYPVVVWPYDVGGTGSVFLATADARDGVQLDLLFDPDGRGRYGARSDDLLAASRPGSTLPAVHPDAAGAYLVIKRLHKGDSEAARRLLYDYPGLVEAASAVLSPQSGQTLAAFVTAGVFDRPRSRTISIGRLARRLSDPVGAWISIEGDETAGKEIADRFGRFLPHSRFLPRVSAAVWARSVAPVRWRAGVVISVGHSAWPKPDLAMVSGAEPDVTARQVVEGLTRRVLGQPPKTVR